MTGTAKNALAYMLYNPRCVKGRIMQINTKYIALLMKVSDICEKQKLIYKRFGAEFFGCDMNLKAGVARNVKDGLRPLNGLRVRPTPDTCGWYIWAGIESSQAPDFFVPLHASHLAQWAPLIVPYIGVPPGWRFLVTEDYEDVWADPAILQD